MRRFSENTGSMCSNVSSDFFFIFIGLQLVRYSFTFSYGNNGFYFSLAIYGVTSWKRGFILPWLIFYSAVKIFLILALISNIMNYALVDYRMDYRMDYRVDYRVDFWMDYRVDYRVD